MRSFSFRHYSLKVAWLFQHRGRRYFLIFPIVFDKFRQFDQFFSLIQLAGCPEIAPFGLNIFPYHLKKIIFEKFQTLLF